jgi:hypothetical protein
MLAVFERHPQGDRRPENALGRHSRESGNPCLEKTLSSHMFAMGLRLRGDGAAGWFEADFRPPVSFNCRI